MCIDRARLLLLCLMPGISYICVVALNRSFYLRWYVAIQYNIQKLCADDDAFLVERHKFRGRRLYNSNRDNCSIVRKPVGDTTNTKQTQELNDEIKKGSGRSVVKGERQNLKERKAEVCTP